MAKKASRRTKTAKPAKKRPTTSRRGPKGKKPPPRTPREPRWLEQLRKRKQPLALQLDDGGRILPAEYHFNSSFDFGVVAQHPEGDIDYGVNRPTWRAFLKIDVPGFRRWSYAKQQAWVTEQYADRYACDDTSPPWSGGQQGMNQWLDQTAETDDPEAGISEWTSEFFVGHPIYELMTPKERRELGVARYDWSSPGGNGPMVTAVTCSMEALNQAFVCKKLPFVVVRDERTPNQ